MKNKLKYYGNLVGNIAFDKTISREQANQLVSLAQKLSYRQIKLLNLYVINQQALNILLRKEDYSKNGISGYNLISVL